MILQELVRFLGVFVAGMIATLAAAAPGSSPSAIIRSEFIYTPGPYPSCHASTLVETTGGELLAAWFGGSAESHPDVCIYLSRFEDGSWTPGSAVADGVQPDGMRYATWNPVLFQPSGGPLMLFYKVGPSPSQWWGMLLTSSDGGRTWSEPRRLPDGVLGPIKNKPIQLADGTILSPSSTEDAVLGWRIHFERSTDLGQTWSVTPPVEDVREFNAIQPSLLLHADGRLQALSRSKEKVIPQTWSTDGGRTWSKMTSTGLYNPNSGSDAVTLADGRQLLVYNMRSHAPGTPPPPKFDSAAGILPGEGGGADDWGVRWPLNVSISRDGVTWHMVVTLESEPNRHGYAYPAVIQTRDGLVHITYTWNRERIKHVVLDPTKL